MPYDGGSKMKKTSKNLLAVSPIESGTVIDHIPAGKSLKILDLLNLPNGEKIMLGVNFSSKKLGRKDIIKVDKKIFTQNELNRIALLVPDSTINIVKNSKVIKKYNLKLQNELLGIIKCPNPKCISYLEPHTLVSKFYVIEKKPLTIKCHFCEREFVEKDINYL